jgi:hypothetical protein
MSVMTKTNLTDVLAQTIISNAEILRLLDPARLQLLLESLKIEATPDSTVPDSAWDDLEHWIAENRRQDIARVESENAPILNGYKPSS